MKNLIIVALCLCSIGLFAQTTSIVKTFEGNVVIDSNLTVTDTLFLGNDTVNNIVPLDSATGSLANSSNLLDSAFISSIYTDTCSSAEYGVLFKGGKRWLYDFRHLTGNTARPTGTNIFLGEEAGNFTIGSTATATTQASSNVGIGFRAGNALTTGYNNILIGRRVGYIATTGYDNVCIGYQSGLLGTTYYRNVFIGMEAGRSSTGSSNVFIGYQAGYNETGNKKLYIENSNSATPLIHGDFDTDIVTINDVLVITPQASAPSSPVEGMVYSNNTDHHFYFYNGSGWVQLDN